MRMALLLVWRSRNEADTRSDVPIVQVDFYWRGDHVFTYYSPTQLKLSGLEGIISMEFSQV